MAISLSSPPMIEPMTGYREKIASCHSTSDDQWNRSLLVKSLKTWPSSVRLLIIKQWQSRLYRSQPRSKIMKAQSRSTVKSHKRSIWTHLISQSISIRSETLTDKPPSWLRCQMRPPLSPRSLRYPLTGVIQKPRKILQAIRSVALSCRKVPWVTYRIGHKIFHQTIYKEEIQIRQNRCFQKANWQRKTLKSNMKIMIYLMTLKRTRVR